MVCDIILYADETALAGPLPITMLPAARKDWKMQANRVPAATHNLQERIFDERLEKL